MGDVGSTAWDSERICMGSEAFGLDFTVIKEPAQNSKTSWIVEGYKKGEFSVCKLFINEPDL